jgi:hypothetical protein
MFGHNKTEKEELQIIQSDNEIILELVGILRDVLKPKQKVRLVLTKSINSQTYIIMALQEAANQTSPLIPALVDQVTGGPVTATFANLVYTSDTPAVATTDANGNLVGVSAGSFNLAVTGAATYTDSTGTLQSGVSVSGTFPGTITAVTVADAVSLVVSLGAATTQTPTPAPTA